MDSETSLFVAKQNVPALARGSARGSCGLGCDPSPAAAWLRRMLSPGGWHDVGVVHEPVDRGVGDGLGHEPRREGS